MKIYVGTDHSGYELKEQLRAWLESEGHEVEDVGAHTYDPTDNYIDFIVPAARAAAADSDSRAIVFGGSGQGEAMAANRIHGARAFVYYSPGKAKGGLDAAGTPGADGMDIVRLSRRHNNSNVLSFGARFVDFNEVKAVTRLWLVTPFEGGRHQARIEAMDGIEP